jgi:hypothetical protein
VDAASDIEGDFGEEDTGFGDSVIPDTQQEFAQELGHDFVSDITLGFGGPSQRTLPPRTSQSGPVVSPAGRGQMPMFQFSAPRFHYGSLYAEQLQGTNSQPPYHGSEVYGGNRRISGLNLNNHFFSQ